MYDITPHQFPPGAVCPVCLRPVTDIHPQYGPEEPERVCSRMDTVTKLHLVPCGHTLDGAEWTYALWLVSTVVPGQVERGWFRRFRRWLGWGLPPVEDAAALYESRVLRKTEVPALEAQIRDYWNGGPRP